ncbi:MAG: valine--pyruvate transaminase [Gammaproteobacteria bacterium]|nr:valine--pyruvate transaminase [Gammaproteobacteria bacterium]
MTNTDYSKFGKRFSRESGITQLMADLGKANHSNDPNTVMLGGGNPAIIPAAHDKFVDELEKLIADSGVDQMIGFYDGPQGSEEFISVLVSMLNNYYDWNLDKKNIAITNGSQSSFFSLFNLFAGEMPNGSHKQILLPIVPEYIGYADQGITDDMFVSIKPKIQMLDDRQFKYQINFEKLISVVESRDIGAICISRPTNPTGNVITDDELNQLDSIAQEYGVPLIIDNAYGQPFPGVIYTQVKPTWNDNTVLCMSLSKLGLPGLRTGIVIANHATIEALSRISGIMVLAPSSVGPSLLTRMIKDQELLRLCHDVIKPYYEEKATTAVSLFNTIFADTDVHLHKIEGAFFMWLWFPNLSITSKQLYKDLKSEGVYIIPGHDFFVGLGDHWDHQHQCIRINYAKDEETLKKGLEAIYRVVEAN